jgi:hypothetical protein
MTNQTSQSTVLSFPDAFKPSGRYTLEDDLLVHEAKLVWSRIINKAVLGIRPLNERDKQCIREINAVCISAGYKPLHHDFENL